MDSTLLKGLAVLDALVRAESDQSVSDLAEQLGLVRSNIHRTLQTLVHAGFAEQVPDSVRYRPTLRLWELGYLALQRFDIREAARPVLERLSNQTSETILLAALDGLDVVYLDKIDARHPVGTYSRIGARAPAYCTAIGKAMLAVAPRSVLNALPLKLAQHTHETITTHAALISELGSVRDRGYSTNQGEWKEGVNGVAASIFDPAHQLIAAIAISGPTSRLGTDEQLRLGLIVKEAAKTISDRINGAATSPAPKP